MGKEQWWTRGGGVQWIEKGEEERHSTRHLPGRALQTGPMKPVPVQVHWLVPVHRPVFRHMGSPVSESGWVGNDGVVGNDTFQIHFDRY